MTNEQKTEAPEHGYLIFKRGMMYRPNSQGYTTEKICAGRYSLKEAISITHPNGEDGPRDGMHYRHESKVSSEAEEIMNAAIGAAEARHKAELEAVLRKAAAVIDDPDFTQEDVDYADNAHKWVLLEEAQTAILALIDQPSALDEMLAEKDAEIELTIAVAKVMEENARLRCAIENYRRAQFDVKGEDQEARKRAARTALFAALEGK